MDRQIGARELRADLATHLRRARAGERITITVGGHPAAVLGPVDGAGGVTMDALVAAGALVPPRRTDISTPSTPTAVWSGTRLDLALREVRG